MSQTAQRYTTPCYSPVGDDAMLIELGSGIDPAINEAVLQLESHIRKLAINGVVETTPAYASLLLHYNPDVVSFAALQETVSTIQLNELSMSRESWLWQIPVCYGGKHGVDLDFVAEYHHLTTAEIIRLHSKPRYRVYMIGFAPGYTYLGGLPEQLHTPRRENPRLHTPSGSISVGGMQALIAGVAMPSGWQLLGQTPVATYAPDRDPPFLITAGDEVQFHPVNTHEFKRMTKAVEKGDWVAERVAMGEPA
ncbi:5-oxoprolinase subunit PxpB [Litorivivens sp.]|uniref:5-oxoprolinase subunit PxpB n=1 Tax=Litorivivens sp. TaxID=2020868 RepID=UPI003569CB3D